MLLACPGPDLLASTAATTSPPSSLLLAFLEQHSPSDLVPLSSYNHHREQSSTLAA